MVHMIEDMNNDRSLVQGRRNWEECSSDLEPFTEDEVSDEQEETLGEEAMVVPMGPGGGGDDVSEKLNVERCCDGEVSQKNKGSRIKKKKVSVDLIKKRNMAFKEREKNKAFNVLGVGSDSTDLAE